MIKMLMMMRMTMPMPTMTMTMTIMTCVHPQPRPPSPDLRRSLPHADPGPHRILADRRATTGLGTHSYESYPVITTLVRK